MEQILIKQCELPQFNLTEPYGNDIWDVMEWDYYKDASEYCQKAWNARSNVMERKMDFTLCQNLIIREEAKYYCYLLVAVKNISLGVFADYADKFKLLFSFVNTGNYKTVLDIGTADYERYIGETHKVKTNNGSALSGGEVIPVKKRNRLISFLDSFKKAVNDFIESSKPVFERDCWHKKDIKPNEAEGITDKKNLDFSTIRHPMMKQAVKDFIYFKLASITFGAACEYLRQIKTFCQWLREDDKNIDSFKDVDRQMIERYFVFLRVESGFSQHHINKNILDLSIMFEYGLLSDDNRFPAVPIFMANDYTFKTNRRAKYYTAEEVTGIFSIIPYLPKVYGKILLLLYYCGMRISEVLRLPIDCLHYNDDVPYITLYMYKTERHHNIPLNNSIHRIIDAEIKKNKRKHPKAKYVFLNEDGSVIQYSTFCKKIKITLLNHNVMGNDGKPLAFRTHRFRSTKATDLINLGENPHKAAEILGMKSLSTLSYYATAKQTSVNEHMQEYLRKESILINSIGKMDEFSLDDYENAIPLCNGWCCRPAGFGVCDKANACLTCPQFKPSSRHLVSYQIQLSELESTLAVAEENGYTRIVEKCKTEIKALREIIEKLEETLNEKHKRS